LEKIGVIFGIGAPIFGAGFWAAYNHPVTYQEYFFWPILILTGFFIFLFIARLHSIQAAKSYLELPRTKEEEDIGFRLEKQSVNWASKQIERANFSDAAFLIAFVFLVVNVGFYNVPNMFNLPLEKNSAASESVLSNNIPKTMPDEPKEEERFNYEIMVVHSDSREYVVESPEQIKVSIAGINLIRTEKNWKNNYVGRWMRLTGAVRIDTSFVSFDDPRGHILVSLEEDDIIKLSVHPDGVSVTVEGQIQYPLGRGYGGVASLSLENGSLLNIKDTVAHREK
jgi:hypothetical protein